MSRAVRPPTVQRPLVAPAIRAFRETPTTGLSRRKLLRGALGGALGLLVVEWTAGTLGYAWSAVVRISPTITIGTLDELVAANPGLPVRDGFPAYVVAARAFVTMVDPSRGSWAPGVDRTGDGTALNVRVLSQVCPHLGCRPNPCIDDFWFHCPCHQSRYDRLGIKAAGERYGPAPRGMDRYAIVVDGDGVLTVDTSTITLGPLPVALGTPGIIPPRVLNGCT